MGSSIAICCISQQMNWHNVTRLTSALFDSCISISLGCSLFSSSFRETRKKIALKLNFFEYVFLMKLCDGLDCVFPNVLPFHFCFHTETQFFFTVWGTEKNVVCILCWSEPIWTSGLYFGHCIWKAILANWSTPGGELTGCSGSSIWRRVHHEKWSPSRAICKSTIEI